MPAPRLLDPRCRLPFPEVPGCYGWLAVKDKALQVYEVDETNEGRTSAYVEATDGARFTVHFLDQRTEAPDGPFLVRVMVDGEQAHCRLFDPNDESWQTPTNEREADFAGKEASDTSILPFTFSKVETTDDKGRACYERDFVKNLGSIQLQMHLVTIQEADDSLEDRPPEVRVVHEDKKKAKVTHQVALGQPIPRERGKRFSFEFRQDEKSPHSELTSRYRSKLMLEVEDLLPYGGRRERIKVCEDEEEPKCLDIDDSDAEVEVRVIKKRRKSYKVKTIIDISDSDSD